MVEFLFTEDNNSVDSKVQPSEYFYDSRTSNMLNNITLHNFIFIDLRHLLCVDILFHNLYLATLSFSIGFVVGFSKFTMVLHMPLQKQPLERYSGK